MSSSSSSGPLMTALVCPVCDESFSRADHLLQHTLVHGQAAKIYKCTHCHLAFVFKSQLINHSFAHQTQTSPPTSQSKIYNLRTHISPRTISTQSHQNQYGNVPITKVAPQLTQIQSNKVTGNQHRHQDLTENEIGEVNGDFANAEEMYLDEASDYGNQQGEADTLEYGEVDNKEVGEEEALVEEGFGEEYVAEEEEETANEGEYMGINDLIQENVNVIEPDEDMPENIESLESPDNANKLSHSENGESVENNKENFAENEEGFVLDENDEEIDNLN